MPCCFIFACFIIIIIIIIIHPTMILGACSSKTPGAYIRAGAQHGGRDLMMIWHVDHSWRYFSCRASHKQYNWSNTYIRSSIKLHLNLASMCSYRMWMQYVFPSMEKKSVCEPMCCLSWSIPFPLNHRPVCGTDYHMTIKVQGCRLYPEFQRKCILYILHRIIFISHTKLQLIIHFPCSNFKKKDQQKKGIQFTSFQGHFCRYDLVPGTSSTSHGSENRHSHWENGGTVGMVPLRINPIYTLYTGYLLDISLLKGSLGS